MAKTFLYTPQEVHEMLKRPYSRQINIIYAKILEAINLTDGKIAVSYSGGADSGMMLYLTCQVWKGIYGNTRPLVVIFANTTNEFKAMHTFVKQFVSYCQDTFGIEIDLHIACGGKSYRDIVLSVGFPFVSKIQARLISDVRKQLKALNLSYSDIEPYIKLNDHNCADKLRQMGFSAGVVCDLTGIKSDNEKGVAVISRQWLPLVYAPFDISHECCNFLKKLPQKKVAKELNGYQPMIGEMADDGKTRFDSYRTTGCNMFDKNGNGVSKPLGATSGNTVRRFYYDNPQVPLFPLYGRPQQCGENCYKYSGEQRTGCKLCGFGIKFDWRRFARLYEIEPETVRNAFKPVPQGGLGYMEICEYLNKHCKCKIVIPNFTPPLEDAA